MLLESGRQLAAEVLGGRSSRLAVDWLEPACTYNWAASGTAVPNDVS